MERKTGPNNRITPESVKRTIKEQTEKASEAFAQSGKTIGKNLCLLIETLKQDTSICLPKKIILADPLNNNTRMLTFIPETGIFVLKHIEDPDDITYNPNMAPPLKEETLWLRHGLTILNSLNEAVKKPNPQKVKNN